MLLQKIIRTVFGLLGVLAPRLGGRLAYKLFFNPFRLKSHPKDLELKDQAKKYELQTDSGKRFHFWVWGDGPAVILAHGWSSKGLHFRNFIPELNQRGFSAVIPDFPGHVFSEGKSTNVLEFKECLNKIVLNLDTEIHALVGHSLGAMASILLLADNEVKVNKLVVHNSAVYSDTIMTRFMEQINGNALIEKHLQDLLLKRFNQSFEYYSTIKRIKEVESMPEVLVVGDEDDIEVPVNEAKELAEATSGELLITQGLGHNNGIKDKDVVRRVAEFIA